MLSIFTNIQTAVTGLTSCVFNLQQRVDSFYEYMLVPVSQGDIPLVVPHLTSGIFFLMLDTRSISTLHMNYLKILV